MRSILKKMKSLLIPDNINIKWGKDFFQVTGPLGSVTKQKGNLSFAIKDNRLYFLENVEDQKKHFYFSMISNLILGVSKGYRCKLRLVGVGFRASIVDNTLLLKIGYSHEIKYLIPEDIKILCGKSKGTLLIIKGKELSKMTQVAADIRNLRLPDAYKGKGIHYDKEVLTLKKGKREGK